MTGAITNIAGEITSGMTLPPRKIQMSITKARLFSLPNESFHTHDQLAQRIGLKVAAPQGLMAYGYLSQMATEFFGPRWVEGGELNVSFTNLLSRDDLLTVNGVVISVETEGRRKRITLDIWVENERGDKVAVGQAIGYQE